MKKFICSGILFIMFFLTGIFNAQQYVTENVVTGLTLPVAFSFMPNGNIIITQKGSGAKIYTPNNMLVSEFWNFTDSLNSQAEQGVLGITLDPSFSQNHYVYIYYVHSNPPNTQTDHLLRVVRFTENNNAGTAPLIIFDHLLTGSVTNHVGGNVHFGRDGKLYISIGENGVSSNAQLLTNPKGKILRINSNGTIPADNPFYDDGNPLTGNDDRIWVYGLRNSFDFTFSSVNDSLYASENGPTDFDEINFITKGRNYGWPTCSGYCQPYNPAYKQPMTVFSGPLLPALTGILIYNSNVMPGLQNMLIAASSNSHVNGYIYQCELGNAPYYDTIISKSQLVDLRSITCLQQGPDGFIYALGIGSGILYRIRPSTNGIENSTEPVNFSLQQNYPNPFNPETTVKYSLLKPGFVKINIYNAEGRHIVTLFEGMKQAGENKVKWNAEGVPSGVYFCKMEFENNTLERKMVVVK